MSTPDRRVGCFSDEVIESYVRGELSKARAGDLEFHVSQCAQCETVLDQLREEFRLAKRLCDAEQALSISDRARVQSAASELLRKMRCLRTSD